MTEHHPDEETEGAREERHRRAERRHWAFEKMGGSVALFLTATAAAGAIASAFATFWAYKETQRTAEAAIAANEIAIRPYIKITLKSEQFIIHTDSVSGNGDVPFLKFTVENTGRLPARVRLQGSANWNSASHPGNDQDWRSPNSNLGQIFLFRGAASPEFKTYFLDFTQGQRTDIQNGNSYFVMVDALYGPSLQYETRVCNAYSMQRSGNTITLGNGEPCPDEDSNYAR